MTKKTKNKYKTEFLQRPLLVKVRSVFQIPCYQIHKGTTSLAVRLSGFDQTPLTLLLFICHLLKFGVIIFGCYGTSPPAVYAAAKAAALSFRGGL